jgi:hypothetical protein
MGRKIYVIIKTEFENVPNSPGQLLTPTFEGDNSV